MKRGADKAEICFGRKHLSVVYADDVQHELSIVEKIGGCGQSHTCGNDVIEHYHSPLTDWAQQHKVRLKPTAVDALDSIAVEWNVEVLRDVLTHNTGEVEAIVMPPPRSGDYAHIIKR